MYVQRIFSGLNDADWLSRYFSRNSWKNFSQELQEDKRKKKTLLFNYQYFIRPSGLRFFIFAFTVERRRKKINK